MDQPLPKTFSKLQLPPINKQSQISIVEIVLLVVIVGLFYWFVISPKKTELSVLNGKLGTLQTEQKNIETQKKSLEKFISEMKSDPESISKLNEGLPFNGKVMVLNILVGKLASEAGVSLDNVSFSAAGENVTAGNRELIADPFAPKRFLKKITGNFSIKGTQEQVENFLQKIEQSGRIFDLSDMQLNVGPEGDFHLSAGITTYYFAP